MLHDFFGLRLVDPCVMVIPPEVVACMPAPLARSENVMPVAVDGRVLTIAVDNPLNLELIDKVRFLTGLEVEIVLAPGNAIRGAVARYYGPERRGGPRWKVR